jgi:segregation and condensation protein B
MDERNEPEWTGYEADARAEEGDMSLAALGAAFAAAMDRRGDSPPPAAEKNDDVAVASAAQPGPSPAGVGSYELPDPAVDPLTILEAMLFVGDSTGAPLTSQRLAGAMRGVAPTEIPELVRELNRRYAAASCPYRIAGVGSGFRLGLTSDFDRLRDKFLGRVRQARLSQAALDVLALVAYNGRLTAEQVSRLRGVPSGPVLAQLVRRRLLRIERAEASRRTVHYLTTERFLALFGLGGLDELPTSQELDRA